MAKPKKIRTVWIRHHRRKCIAMSETLKGVWGNPWGVIAEDTHFRRHELHFVLKCNDPDCPAEIAVNLNDVSDSLPPLGF